MTPEVPTSADRMVPTSQQEPPQEQATLVPPVVWPLLLSALAWSVIFIAMPPWQQNFPLHDDWAFARSAFALYRGEGIRYFQWASMPQLGQWLWAMPFIAVLGPWHFTLRISTIFMGWVALLAFYDLLRQAGVSKGQSAFAMAVLAFNPWFFLSQGTFMTDVPSLAFALGALALYGRALSQRSLTLLVGAVVVALLGAITRQNTVAVGLAAAVFLAFQPALRRRPLWWLGVLLPVAVAFWVHRWFMARTDIKPMPLDWPSRFHTLHVGWVILHTLGLIAIPVLLLDLRSLSWKRFAIALPIILLAAFAWWRNGRWLPTSSGVPPTFMGFFPYTGGVLDIKGAFSYALTIGHRDWLLTPPLCIFLSLLGCAGAAALVARAPERIRPGGLLLLFSLIQVPLILAVPKLYDRYLEFLMPAGLFLATTTRPIRLGRWVAGGTALAISAVVSVGLMHDWLAWNEARWAVAQRAVDRGVHPWDIEGGFEWDGWFAPSPFLPPRDIPPNMPHMFYSRVFSHVNSHYAIAFSVLPGAVDVDSQPYHLWLQAGTKKMYLIKAILPKPEEPGPPLR